MSIDMTGLTFITFLLLLPSRLNWKCYMGSLLLNDSHSLIQHFSEIYDRNSPNMSSGSKMPLHSIKITPLELTLI